MRLSYLATIQYLRDYVTACLEPGRYDWLINGGGGGDDDVGCATCGKGGFTLLIYVITGGSYNANKWRN